MSEIRAAVEVERDLFAAAVERRIRETYAAAVAVHGPGCRGVRNDPRFARVWRETMNSLTTSVQTPGKPWEYTETLDDDRVAKKAAQVAEDTVAAIVAKLEEKLGDLDAGATYARSGSFAQYTVRGTRGGKDVRVEQAMILNVSSHGRLFNQFPALIYVDGKKTSAAAFARMGARA